MTTLTRALATLALVPGVCPALPAAHAAHATPPADHSGPARNDQSAPPRKLNTTTAVLSLLRSLADKSNIRV